jgi:hypothetical protein
MQAGHSSDAKTPRRRTVARVVAVTLVLAAFAGAADTTTFSAAAAGTAATQQLTPQQIAQAKAEYAEVLAQVNACEAGGGSANPACLLKLQAAMSEYETFLETSSQLISGWMNQIHTILQNIH